MYAPGRSGIFSLSQTALTGGVLKPKGFRECANSFRNNRIKSKSARDIGPINFKAYAITILDEKVPSAPSYSKILFRSAEFSPTFATRRPESSKRLIFRG